MITFSAPASRCLAASARAVKKPVDSITTSTPRSPQGRAAGSRSERTLTSSPPAMIVLPSTSTPPGKRPRIESYLSRWAIVSVSTRSLTATKSMSAFASLAARKTLRPMRPKPLMPTFTAMNKFLLDSVGEAGRLGSRSYGLGTFGSALVGADADLDLVPVRVTEKGGIGARPVRALLAGIGDADAARFHPILPGRLHRDDSQRREAQQAEARRRIVLAGDEEDGLGDAPADRPVLLEMASPPQRGQHRVVEGGAAVEIADLQEDVVEHG